MDRPTLRSELFVQPNEVRAALHEDGDGLILRSSALTLEDTDYMLELPALVVRAHAMQLDTVVIFGAASRRARIKARRSVGNLILRRKCAGERPIYPLDNCRRAAEIVREDQGIAINGADTALFDPQEQGHVRIAEAVYRLHRVADQE